MVRTGTPLFAKYTALNPLTHHDLPSTKAGHDNSSKENILFNGSLLHFIFAFKNYMGIFPSRTFVESERSSNTLIPLKIISKYS